MIVDTGQVFLLVSKSGRKLCFWGGTLARHAQAMLASAAARARRDT